MDNTLNRSRDSRMISGVCSGLARHFDIEVSLVRIGFVVATFFPFPTMAPLIYGALWILLPEEGTGTVIANGIISNLKDAWVDRNPSGFPRSTPQAPSRPETPSFQQQAESLKTEKYPWESDNL
ncbi:MAG: PspC domain-containing protein [Propionibacteriaceae bacterium]